MPIESVGQGIQRLGDVLMGIGLAERQRQNEAHITDLEVQVSREAAEMLSGLGQESWKSLVRMDGEDTGATRIGDWLQKHKDAADRIGGGMNRSLSEAYRSLIAKTEMHAFDHYTRIKAGKFKDYDRAMLGEFLKTQDEAYQGAPNDASRAAVMANAIAKIESRAGGSLDEQETIRLKNEWADQAHEKYVLTKIEKMPFLATQDPGHVNQMFSDLTSPAKYPFISAASTARIMKKFAEVRKEAMSSGVYGTLYKTFNGDFAMMGTFLSDPANKEKLGISMEEIDYLRGFISRAGEDQRKLETHVHAETAKKMYLGLRTLKPKQIDAEVAAGRLDYKTAEYFKNELKQVGEARTDPGTYDRFLRRIYGDPENPEAVRAELIRSGGLSRSDKERLLAKTEANIEKTDARNLSRAMGYLKETVKPSETMVSQAKPEEALNYLRAADAMEQAVLRARSSGKPLTAKQVIETAEEISRTYRMSAIDQTLAAQRRMAEDAKRMRELKTPPVAVDPKQAGGGVLRYDPATGALR